MEWIADLLKILLPAGLAVYGMYIVTLSFLKKEWEKRVLELKTKNTDTILPLRIQAAERLCLLLERITPNNLVRRINQGGLSASELYVLLINEVREEFNHNLSQQVYFSDDAWEDVRNAVEQVITLINRANQGLASEALGIELAKRIFQLSLESENDVVASARKKIKSEIQVYF
ncbi:hypothetical protein [Lunatimonas salinarum]|uniref:DUF7935 family protein n=1 Tax=Lunatimonas salinarum TaxID=1774590 RepID=UPI001AE012A7|nr:hypothetical protein [Lunatimonas salinarum]